MVSGMEYVGDTGEARAAPSSLYSGPVKKKDLKIRPKGPQMTMAGTLIRTGSPSPGSSRSGTPRSMGWPPPSSRIYANQTLLNTARSSSEA